MDIFKEYPQIAEQEKLIQDQQSGLVKILPTYEDAIFDLGRLIFKPYENVTANTISTSFIIRDPKLADQNRISNIIKPLLEEDLATIDSISFYLYDLKAFVEGQEITFKKAEEMGIFYEMVDHMKISSNSKDAFDNFIKSKPISDADLKLAWSHYMLKVANIYTIVIKQYEKRIATMKSVLADSERIITHVLRTLQNTEEHRNKGVLCVGLCVQIKRCIEFVSEKVEVNGIDLMKNFPKANKHRSLEKLSISALCDILKHLFDEIKLRLASKFSGLLKSNSILEREGDQNMQW